jgi:hypothetical protein
VLPLAQGSDLAAPSESGMQVERREDAGRDWLLVAHLNQENIPGASGIIHRRLRHFRNQLKQRLYGYGSALINQI